MFSLCITTAALSKFILDTLKIKCFTALNMTLWLVALESTIRWIATRTWILGLSLEANLTSTHFPSFCTVHSCWQRGHLLLCLIHKLMQHWWKLWLHSPHTTTQSLAAEESLESALDSAWHLKQASITWTRHMAQVSHSTSQLHIATAFHFFNVKSFQLQLDPQHWLLHFFPDLWVMKALMNLRPCLIKLLLLFKLSY